MKLIVFIAIFLGACLAVFYCNKNRSDLKRNGVLVVGKVDRAYRGPKGGIYIDYEFKVSDRTLIGGALYFISSKFVGEFQNRTFPVIYSISNPNRNMMLILQSNFSDYGIVFPDSLLW